jgi:uncharacterized protein YkwD
MPRFNHYSPKFFSKHSFEKKAGHWFNDKHDKPETTKPVPAPESSKPDPAPEPASKPGPVTAPEPSTGMSPTQLEAAFLKLVNEDRAKAGANPLTTDSELITAARAHSAWMDGADTLSHTGRSGSSPSDRIEDAGYASVRSAENIAYIAGSRADVLDMPDVVQLHTNLMNSSGHRANLMNPALTEIGIGLRQGDMKGMSAVFVTQNFGTPTTAEASEDSVGLAGVNPSWGADAFHV